MNIKLNKIINEELERVINQPFGVEPDDLIFKQQIVNSSFFNYDNFSKNYDVDVIQSNIFITWHIAFLINANSIIKFEPKIDKVEGLYRVDFRDKQTDELVQQTDKNISDLPWKFDIVDAILHIGEGLYIEELNFDFSKNICSVSFFEA